MEQHIYHPFDVRMTEDEEIIAIVEPDSYIQEMIENDKTCWEVDVDVDYDEEEHEPYLMVTLLRITARYLWLSLTEKHGTHSLRKV